MNKFILMSAALFSGFALVAGCGNPNTNQTTAGSVDQAKFDTSAIKKEIMAANQDFAQNLAKGDSVALANDYTPDAKFMNSNMPAVTGRKNIQHAFSGFIKFGVAHVTFVTLGVWGSESGVAEEGTFSLTTKDGHQIDKGKYLVLWKKEAGKWKMFRDCSNSDLPLPAAK